GLVAPRPLPGRSAPIDVCLANRPRGAGPWSRIAPEEAAQARQGSESARPLASLGRPVFILVPFGIRLGRSSGISDVCSGGGRKRRSGCVCPSLAAGEKRRGVDVPLG